MKKIFLILSIIIIITGLSYPQENLLSAGDLLKSISENFKKNVKDFKADIKWTQGASIQKGKLYFKNPQKLKILFTDPANQVICTNGYELWIFIPYMSLVLHQDILHKSKKKSEEGKTVVVDNPVLLTPEGLDKFISDYSIEFNETKQKVNYKDTKVYQFKLIRWKKSRSFFNFI